MADQCVLRRLHGRVRQNGILLDTMQVHKREVHTTGTIQCNTMPYNDASNAAEVLFAQRVTGTDAMRRSCFGGTMPL